MALEESIASGDAAKETQLRKQLMTRYNDALKSSPVVARQLIDCHCWTLGRCREIGPTSVKWFKDESTGMFLAVSQWKWRFDCNVGYQLPHDEFLLLIESEVDGERQSRVAARLRCNYLDINSTENFKYFLSRTELLRVLEFNGETKAVRQLIKAWLGCRKFQYREMLLSACATGCANTLKSVKDKIAGEDPKFDFEYYTDMMHSAMVRGSESSMVLIHDWCCAEGTHISYNECAWRAIDDLHVEHLKLLKKLSPRALCPSTVAHPNLVCRPNESLLNDKRNNIRKMLERWNLCEKKKAQHKQVLSIALGLGDTMGLWEMAWVVGWATEGPLSELEVLRSVEHAQASIKLRV